MDRTIRILTLTYGALSALSYTLVLFTFFYAIEFLGNLVVSQLSPFADSFRYFK